jgi:hypothetical protein
MDIFGVESGENDINHARRGSVTRRTAFLKGV